MSVLEQEQLSFQTLRQRALVDRTSIVVVDAEVGF